MDKWPKTSAIINTPAPVKSHADVAPNGLAIFASVLGSEKMPEPTIFPTTNAVNNQKPHFFVCSIPVPPGCSFVRTRPRDHIYTQKKPEQKSMLKETHTPLISG